MSPQSHCPGVSLDRNFDVAWSYNNSVNSCHQNYPGPAPFSEAETRAVRDIFHKYSHKIVAYLNVHAGTFFSSTFKVCFMTSKTKLNTTRSFSENQ